MRSSSSKIAPGPYLFAFCRAQKRGLKISPYLETFTASPPLNASGLPRPKSSFPSSRISVYAGHHKKLRLPGDTKPSHTNLHNSCTLCFTPISYPILILEGGFFTVPSETDNLLAAKSSMSSTILWMSISSCPNTKTSSSLKTLFSLQSSQSDCFSSHSPGRNHWAWR